MFPPLLLVSCSAELQLAVGGAVVISAGWLAVVTSACLAGRAGRVASKYIVTCTRDFPSHFLVCAVQPTIQLADLSVLPPPDNYKDVITARVRYDGCLATADQRLSSNSQTSLEVRTTFR